LSMIGATLFLFSPGEGDHPIQQGHNAKLKG